MHFIDRALINDVQARSMEKISSFVKEALSPETMARMNEAATAARGRIVSKAKKNISGGKSVSSTQRRLLNAHEPRLKSERSKHWGVTNFFRDMFGMNDRKVQKDIGISNLDSGMQKYTNLMNTANKSNEAEAFRMHEGINALLKENSILREQAGAGGGYSPYTSSGVPFANKNPWWDRNKSLLSNLFNVADKAVTNETADRWVRGAENWGAIGSTILPLAGMGINGLQEMAASRQNQSILNDPTMRMLMMGGLGAGIGGLGLYGYRQYKKSQKDQENPYAGYSNYGMMYQR